MFPSLLPQDLNLIDKESEDVLERIMDEKTASESKILHGHSGPVYGVSFSPDRYNASNHFYAMFVFTLNRKCLLKWNLENYSLYV